MKDILEKIKADPLYQKNIEYGEPRLGHPEGKVKQHIADLEKNLEFLKKIRRIPNEDDYWKLKFMIHVHDLFKVETDELAATFSAPSHATLARDYASQFIEDIDLLNMIQYHDVNYELWKEYLKNGQYDRDRFLDLLRAIKDWDIFLSFTIIDGCTKGKDYGKLSWFINEVKKYKTTKVEADWVLDPK